MAVLCLASFSQCEDFEIDPRVSCSNQQSVHFSLLSRIPLYEYAALCQFILLIDIWVVSRFKGQVLLTTNISLQIDEGSWVTCHSSKGTYMKKEWGFRG